MSVWTWFYQFDARARAAGDAERMRLVDLYYGANKYEETDPQQRLSILEQGRALAEKLNEPWWVLFFDHWRIQTLLFKLRDYQAALALAVQATVEARQSHFDQFPQRVCLHRDLIDAYADIDPVGYADLIAQAHDYMHGQITPAMECRYCLQSSRVALAIQTEQLEQAKDEALRYAELSERDDHHLSAAYTNLAHIAYQRREWDALRQWANEGEVVARRDGAKLDLIEFLAWQAFLARQAGEETEAKRLYTQATSHAARLGSKPSTAYYGALCAYHQHSGEFDLALQVRDRELAEVLKGGSIHDECQCRLRRCELLVHIGRPLDEELAAARQAAEKLRNPQPYLAKLEGVAQGKVDFDTPGS